jgi:putative membrane protein
VTPHAEIKLIREGNSAAALSFSGALIGFVMPLASVISHSASIADVALWGGVALVVQVFAFFVARVIVPDLPKEIETGKLSVGAFTGLVSLTFGLLNAACMTP